MTGRTVVERGRRKAYRPLSPADRQTAFRAGLAAYDRRDFFLAHELLEPAWMGSDDPAERALYSGLIKLAAAGVHGARGNPKGLVTNLTGARDRLAALVDGELEPGPEADRLDLAALVAAIDDRLVAEAIQPSSADSPAIPRRS